MNYKQQIQKRAFQEIGEPATLDELGHFVIRSVNTFTEANIVGLAWEIRYGNINNSHYNPINGSKNFSRDPTKPTLYSGWHGRLWVRYDTQAKPKNFGSTPIEVSLIHTGTGGFGSYDGPWKKIYSLYYKIWRGLKGKNKEENRELTVLLSMLDKPQVYSWDFRFFADDFPAIKHNREREDIIAALQNRTPDRNHKFLWQDPSTVKQDAQFANAISEFNQQQLKIFDRHGQII